MSSHQQQSDVHTSLVSQARDGDRAALEQLIESVQGRVYNIALRMLWHPADAEDATQEILIRVITNLGSFRGESAFSTWVHRVAANYLLTTRKRLTEQRALSFEQFGAELANGLSDTQVDVEDEVEHALLLEEVKIGCTHGMLLCLDRDHRLAYILGDIFEVNSVEGGYILEITPAAFRKRLSRARATVQRFMLGHCGIVNPANPCRCARRVDTAIQIGRVDPLQLHFATHPRTAREGASTTITELNELQRSAALYRSHPDFAAPESFARTIRELLNSQKIAALE